MRSAAPRPTIRFGATVGSAAVVLASGCACVSRVEPTPESITRFVHPKDTVRMKIYTGGRLKLLVTARLPR